MADTKITGMPAATTLTGTEVVAGVQSGANVKITTDQIKTLARVATWSCIGFSAVGFTVTGNTTETTLATVTIPANAMGVNGILRVHTTWSYSNNANVKTLKVRFGGIGGTTYFNTTTTTTATFKHVFQLANRGVANSQVAGTSSGSTAGIWSSSTGAVVTSNVDTTAETTLVFTGQLANSADNIILEAYLVELLNG